MFVLRWSSAASKTYEKLKEEAAVVRRERPRKVKAKGKRKSSKQEGLFKQVHKAVTLLASNPKHPGLHTHEFDSIENPYDRNEKVFEAYAQNKTPGAYRVFWCNGPGKQEITIIAITPHP